MTRPAVTAHPGGIVDLVAIGHAAQPLAAWWRRLLELDQPGLQRLDDARRALAELGPVPGRLGRAIDLVARCDVATPDTEMAAAIAMLVELAERLAPGASAATAPERRPRPVPAGHDLVAGRLGEQLQLPLNHQTAG